MLSRQYNVYCDESCHLENDRQPVMLIGAVWCPKNRIRQISEEIRHLKIKHNARGELKWIKVSKSKVDFYFELLEYFFQNTYLHHRCLVVKNKEKLDHDSFNQGSHDTFYYKMFFSMLNQILDPIYQYNLYLDIKDTRSKYKIEQLKEVLCNNRYDFKREMIVRVQHIRSHESELLQLTDFLTGAIGYRNRNLSDNKTKTKLIDFIEDKIAQPLTNSTSLVWRKFNIFILTLRDTTGDD